MPQRRLPGRLGSGPRRRSLAPARWVCTGGPRWSRGLLAQRWAGATPMNKLLGGSHDGNRAGASVEAGELPLSAPDRDRDLGRNLGALAPDVSDDGSCVGRHAGLSHQPFHRSRLLPRGRAFKGKYNTPATLRSLLEQWVPHCGALAEVHGSRSDPCCRGREAKAKHTQNHSQQAAELAAVTLAPTRPCSISFERTRVLPGRSAA